MANKTGITVNILGRLSRNESLSMENMRKCRCLDCNISDVVEFVWQKEGE